MDLFTNLKNAHRLSNIGRILVLISRVVQFHIGIFRMLEIGKGARGVA